MCMRAARRSSAWSRPRGEGIAPKSEDQPHAKQIAHAPQPRCGARTRSGSPCQSPAMPNGRCRMHGGMSPGAPKGNKNAFKHGRYTAEKNREPARDREAVAGCEGSCEAGELSGSRVVSATLESIPEKPAPNYRRLSRYDETGLIWLLRGRPVVAIPMPRALSNNPPGPSRCIANTSRRRSAQRSETMPAKEEPYGSRLERGLVVARAGRLPSATAVTV